jgi:hypothetical protein
LAVQDTKRPQQASIEFTISSSPVIQPGERIESGIEAANVARESHLLPPGFGHGDDTTTAADNQMAEGVERAMHALVQMDNAPLALSRGEGAVSNPNTVVNEVTSQVGSWQPLLEKLQLFKDVVDKIAEVCYLAKYILSVLSHNGTLRFQVHPYAKMAWSILSAIPQVCHHHATENLYSDVLTGDPRADRLFLPSCTSTRVSVASLRLWLMFTPSCLTPILSRARG